MPNKEEKAPRILVSIRSLDDLARILQTQKMLALKARKDLSSLDSSALTGSDEVALRNYLREERDVLQKWAELPTLSEFNLSTSLVHEDSKWGATFGVAVLVQDLILEQVYSQQKRLKPLLRKIFVLMLDYMEQSRERNDILAYVLTKIKISISVDKSTTTQTSDEIARGIMGQMIDTFLAVGVAFGVFADGNTYETTALGARVYWHLIDIQRFIDILAEAHRVFQREKPKLSMV
jgi:hypothetical protein